MATSADVPYKYDVVINGTGFMLTETDKEKSELGYTPAFIPRTNTQGNYGDNQQDFWMTFSQKDWSLGEKQRFARPSDDESQSRFWRGDNIDISTQGQVTLRPLTNQTSAFGAAVTECAGAVGNDVMIATGVSNLYEMNAAGTITDRGAHGLGAAPRTLIWSGLGGASAYFSTTGVGTVGVRHWSGAAFSTFSATAADSLAYLNNALYGLNNNAELLRYDTAGVSTVLFTWRTSAGGALTTTHFELLPFGGKLLILRSESETGAELWLYDGTAPAKIADFGSGFSGYDLSSIGGVVFISGLLEKRLSSTDYVRPAIFFYANGTTGKLWQADSWVASTAAREPRSIPFAGGIVFIDDTRGEFMFYDPNTGGIHSIGNYTFTDQPPRIAATRKFVLHTRAATTPYRHPADGISTSGYAISSLIDFDSSFDKAFRGIRVDWDDDITDTGATVDIAYRVNDLDGSYTTLQTGAVSGFEYSLSGVTGRSISVKITLNKTNSTFGPALKRIYVRAVPLPPVKRKCTYLLDLTGQDGKQERRTRDGGFIVGGGNRWAPNLFGTLGQTAISVTDSLGTYLGVIEDIKFIQQRSREYIARVEAREI